MEFENVMQAYIEKRINTFKEEYHKSMSKEIDRQVNEKVA